MDTLPPELIGHVGRFLELNDRKSCAVSGKVFHSIHAHSTTHVYSANMTNIHTHMKHLYEKVGIIRTLKPCLKELNLFFDKVFASEALCAEIYAANKETCDIIQDIKIVLIFNFCDAEFVQCVSDIFPTALIEIAVMTDITSYLPLFAGPIGRKKICSLSIGPHENHNDIIQHIAHIPNVKYILLSSNPGDCIDLSCLDMNLKNNRFILTIATTPVTYVNIGKATHIIIDEYSMVGDLFCHTIVTKGPLRVREIIIQSFTSISHTTWLQMISQLPKTITYIITAKPQHLWYIEQLHKHGITSIRYFAYDTPSYLDAHMSIFVYRTYKICISEKFNEYDIVSTLHQSAAWHSNPKQTVYDAMDVQQQSAWFIAFCKGT